MVERGKECICELERERERERERGKGSMLVSQRDSSRKRNIVCKTKRVFERQRKSVCTVWPKRKK